MSAHSGSAQVADAPVRALHARSFKLRFAAQREPGRSYVSLVKPLALPATVTDKFYSGSRGAESSPPEERALCRIQDMFESGPRDKYPEPTTTTQQYGWWSCEIQREESVVRHHIRDSAWMKERLRVLADDKLKQK